MVLPSPDEVWTMAELAEEFGVQKNTANRWRHRKDVTLFPEPVFSIGATNFYSIEEVRRWYELWSRTQSKGGQRAAQENSSQ